MIMFGANIQSPADPLRKIQEEYLYNSLRNPKPQIAAKIRQLRVAYQIDTKQYSLQKRCLPYVVCGIFNPPYRRTENFAYTECFIVDIDHIATKGMSLDDIRSKLCADSRVMMCFASPSEDGLKVMFRLKERCYDAGLYSVFYKEFLRQFSLTHGLEQVADARTSDVTRACFISVDLKAYYNLLSEPVELEEYVNTLSPVDLLDMKVEQDKETKEQSGTGAAKEQRSSDPDKDVMDRIKQCLQLKSVEKPSKQVAFVPEQLVEIMGELKTYVEETGLVVTEIISIQYGKKIRIKMAKKEAEINLFYGKRGFTVVKSPRCGTNSELNEVCAELIQSFVNTITN